MNPQGHSFEIIVCKLKKEFRKCGFLTWSDNFKIRVLFEVRLASQENVVVYSYNNPTKINDQVTFSMLDILLRC